MNNYPGINPKIILLIKKYADILAKSFNYKINTDEFEQELLLYLVETLPKFDPKQGYILSFINRVLFLKTKALKQYWRRDKRKTIFYEKNLSDPACYTNKESILIDKINLQNIIDLLPVGLQKLIHEKKENPKYKISKQQISLIQKIICAFNNKKFISEGAGKMKNISCIETLSVRELSKLSETDLCDLSEKVTETYNWIKQVKEKFETALNSKYLDEATKTLNDNKKDFGTASFKKNEHVITVEIPKKVQWNQEMLAKIYEKMDTEARNEIFKVTYSIGEKEYGKLSQNLLATIEPARSIAYGKIKISIAKGDNA